MTLTGYCKILHLLNQTLIIYHMKKLFYKLFFLVILFIVSSCNLDNFDFNKLSDDVSLSPEFVMPLARANISIWDIIESVNEENDTLIKKGENDIIKIVYTEEGIYDYQVKEFLDLPENPSIDPVATEIGTITLNNISRSKGLSIKDLQDKLSGAIDNITDGPSQIPNMLYENQNEVYEVDPISNFENINILSGNLVVTLSNTGFTQGNAITIGGQFYDKNSGTILASFLIEDVVVHAPKEKLTILKNLSISNEINFRLTKFEIISNTQTETVDLNAELFKLDLSFKDIEINSGKVKIEAQTIAKSGSFNFDFEESVKVFKAEMNYGDFRIRFSKPGSLNISGSVEVTFPSMLDKNGVSLKFEGNNTPEFGGDEKTLGLSGVTINFPSDGVKPYNTISYEYVIKIEGSDTPVDFNSKDMITMNATLIGLDYQSISGDFGNKNITIDNGSFNMDMAFLDKIEGDFKLANPQLKLILTNGIGVPAEVNADFVAQNKSGQSVSLNPDPFRLLMPASLGSAAVTQTVTFNKTNSNIVDFVALPPSGNISYSGNIVFNPDGAVTAANANFFDLDAGLKIDLGVDLPFELQINNLTFSDTVKMDSGDLDMVKRAELIINAVNEIPLDIDVQLFFIDTISGQQYSSSAKNKLLTAAQVSDAGVITAVTSSNSFVLEEDELEGLKKANGIVFKGSISSPAGGTKTAVIYSQSKLDMNVVIKSKIDL